MSRSLLGHIALWSVALTACLSARRGAKLYDSPHKLSPDEIATLQGHVQWVDGQDVSSLPQPLELLPGCHQIVTPSHWAQGSPRGAQVATTGQVTMGLLLRAGRHYQVTVDATPRVGVSPVDGAHLIARELPGHGAPPNGNAGVEQCAWVDAALARAREQVEHGEYAVAIRVALQALGGVQQGDTVTRPIAELREVLADASFELMADESVARYELALKAWEAVPGAEEDVARVAGSLGWVLVISEDDLGRAEQLYRRSLSLLEQRHGASHPALIPALFWLLDLLDQECRTTEAESELAHLVRIYAANPGDPWAPFYLTRTRAQLARRRGDADRSLYLMSEALHKLSDTEAIAHDSAVSAKRVGYLFLAELALDAGRYPELLKATEQAAAVVGAERHAGGDSALELHFAYAATSDARLSAHDAKFVLHSARAGAALFPAALPPLQACLPEAGPKPRGWLFRSNEASEQLASCAEKSATSLPSDAELAVLMRVQGGVVVAAEATARNVADALVVECAAKSVLDVPVPAPHDFNFITAHWNNAP